MGWDPPYVKGWVVYICCTLGVQLSLFPKKRPSPTYYSFEWNNILYIGTIYYI